MNFLLSWLRARPPLAVQPAAAEARLGVAPAAPVASAAALGATDLQAPAPQSAAAPPLAPELQFFAWIMAAEPLVGVGLTALEGRLLAHLDATSASESARRDLVPRARTIIPRLMHSLRDDNHSAQALAAQVARDANLVVEVIRLANSTSNRAGPPVADLTQALARLGTDGLRRAIARILLKPIFDAQADPLLARAAARLWWHSEAMATLCLQTAARVQVDAFDAYLAGLLHNVGWTATLRALGRSGEPPPEVFTGAMVRALAPRRDRLFALLLQSWDLSAVLNALAAQLLAVGAGSGQLPLGIVLHAANRAALLQLQREAAGP